MVPMSMNHHSSPPVPWCHSQALPHTAAHYPQMQKCTFNLKFSHFHPTHRQCLQHRLLLYIEVEIRHIRTPAELTDFSFSLSAQM